MRRTLLVTSGLLAVGLSAGLTACSTGTGSPAAATRAAAEQHAALTVASTTEDGTTVLASTTVGDSVFLLGRRDGEVRIAASLDGGDPDRNWELVEPRSDLGATEADVVSAANFPTAAPDGVAQLAGRAGADVTSVDVRAHDGTRHEATVHDGWWLTAWGGHDFDDAATLPESVTVHLEDGTTRTETYQQLSER